MADRKKWRMVRLTVSTVERLREVGRMWADSYGLVQHVPAPDDRWGYSLDYVIMVLLGRDEAHRRRARKSISSPSGSIGDKRGRKGRQAKTAP